MTPDPALTKFRTVIYAWLLIASISVTPAAARTVTFAYQTPTLNSVLPLIVGQDFGFFSAEGLEVKTIFIRGGPTAIAALVGGDVDYTIAAGVPAVRAGYHCQRPAAVHGLHADRRQRDHPT